MVESAASSIVIGVVKKGGVDKIFVVDYVCKKYLAKRKDVLRALDTLNAGEILNMLRLYALKA